MVKREKSPAVGPTSPHPLLAPFCLLSTLNCPAVLCETASVPLAQSECLSLSFSIPFKGPQPRVSSWRRVRRNNHSFVLFTESPPSLSRHPIVGCTRSNQHTQPELKREQKTPPSPPLSKHSSCLALRFTSLQTLGQKTHGPKRPSYKSFPFTPFQFGRKKKGGKSTSTRYFLLSFPPRLHFNGRCPFLPVSPHMLGGGTATKGSSKTLVFCCNRCQLPPSSGPRSVLVQNSMVSAKSSPS